MIWDWRPERGRSGNTDVILGRSRTSGFGVQGTVSKILGRSSDA
jgi:hypothetical protein